MSIDYEKAARAIGVTKTVAVLAIAGGLKAAETYLSYGLSGVLGKAGLSIFSGSFAMSAPSFHGFGCAGLVGALLLRLPFGLWFPKIGKIPEIALGLGAALLGALIFGQPLMVTLLSHLAYEFLALTAKLAVVGIFHLAQRPVPSFTL